jgi:hypothetical protein
MAAMPLPLAAGFDTIVWVIIILASFVVWVYNQIKKANEDAARKAQPPPPQPEPRQPPPRRQQQPARGQQPARQRLPARPTLADRPALGSPQAAEADPWDKPEAVASHVQRHLDTHEFDQRTGSLGQLSRLDTEVDDHVHKAFDHAVGTITDQGAVTEGEQAAGAPAQPTATTAAAAGIAEMLADPDSLRSAIILQEILRPPQWDEGGR